MENFDAALDQIISLMNLTEKQKVKRVEVLNTLEKKVVRQLQKGKTEAAIEELKNIIDEYKSLGLNKRAEILEFTLNEFIKESNQNLAVEIEPTPPTEKFNKQNALQVLEFRSKKAIRRVLQGKLKDAESEILDIVREFRDLGMNDRAQALDGWLRDFQVKKSDIEELNKPLDELLRNDSALQEQLLSYRTQKVLKQFKKGNHKKAVIDFTEIVNDYKRQGKLEIVEVLEIWFNLFITKTFLVKSKTAAPPPQKPAPIKPSPIQPPIRQSTPLQPPIKQLSPSQLPIEQGPPKPQSMKQPAPIAITKSPKTSTEPPLSEDPFKAKISKIQSLLKKFEDSL